MFNLAVNWDVDPQIFEGYKTPNWYGLLFVSGLILGYFFIKKVFKKEGVKDELLDKLVLYMVIATVVGARLGHVLFYGPYFDKITAEGLVVERGYFSHPLDIVKIWEGGLASHGAAIVIAVALWLFAKKVIQKPYLWMLDRIAASLAVGAAFIRLGNLANSEIVGNVTSGWGFRFMRNDCYPPFDCSWADIPVRHPAQLYESVSYFILFALLIFLFWKKQMWRKQGFIFGFYLVFTFVARFLIEFVKIGQAERDDYLFLNTGQLLSIPFVLIGGWIMVRAFGKKEQK